jgi:hypothetical protein
MPVCHFQAGFPAGEVRPMISQLLEGNSRFVAEEFKPNETY